MAIDEEKVNEKDTWQMYFDEVVNQFRKGIGVVLLSLDRKQFLVAIKFYFECTNNIAKYEACVNGLLLAINIKVKNLDLYGDSTLITY